MRKPKRNQSWFLIALVTLATLLAHPVATQAQSGPAAQPPAAIHPEETADTQQQMLKLLRLSPTLTDVVARDPSLLANQAYVSQNNPELAQFLKMHPEVARNPEFYLFSNLGSLGGNREHALERAVWPEYMHPDYQQPPVAAALDQLQPILIVGFLFCALVLIVRYVVESRRSLHFYKAQGELHTRLIDKFATNQELSAYLESEAGKRLFEGAPIALGSGQQPGLPNVVARVLTPVQIGTVMVLLGIGLLILPLHGAGYIGSLVAGTLVLMPGIGFILSAGITWILARRLALLPKPETANRVDAELHGPDDGRRERL